MTPLPAPCVPYTHEPGVHSRANCGPPQQTATGGRSGSKIRVGLWNPRNVSPASAAVGFEDLGLLPFSPGGAALAGLLPRVWTGSPFFVSSSEAELRACSSGGVGGVLGLRTSGTSLFYNFLHGTATTVQHALAQRSLGLGQATSRRSTGRTLLV